MMGKYLMQMCLVALCMLEVVLCYVIVSRMVRFRIKPEKLEWLVVIVGVALVGSGLGFYRNILFFANNVWMWTMIICAVWTLVILRRNVVETIELVVIYCGIVTLLDFFLAFLIMNHLQEQFWSHVWFMTMSWWGILIYAVSRALVLVLVLILHKLLPMEVEIKDYKIAFLVIAAGICLLVRFYYYLLWHLAETVPYVKIQSVCISVLVLLVLLFLIMLLFLKGKIMQRENESVMIKREAQEKQFHEVQAVTEKNYGLVHDIKNHILILKGLAEKEDIEGLNIYLAQIAENSFAITHQKWTGCHVLDILLNQKQQMSEQEGIQFTVFSSGTIRLGLSDMELVSLFGNLLDNAIEACRKVPVERRDIQIIIERKNDIVFAKVSNSVFREPVMKDGELVSCKQEKGRHGYGLKNVKAILENNGGDIQYKFSDQVFSVIITFFDNTLQEEEKKENEKRC